MPSRRSVKNSMACVIPDLPAGDGGKQSVSCRLLSTSIDNLMAKHGVSDEHIVMRVTGCPNSLWSRDAGGKWAAVGKAPGRYNLHLGGNRIGTRIPRMYKENITEAGNPRRRLMN